MTGSLSTPTGRGWLEEAVAAVRRDPEQIVHLFPAAGRNVGRHPLPERPRWTVDDAARVELLTALPPDEELVPRVKALYRYGDAAEKRGVLRALPALAVGAECTDLLEDALRTNDTRLVAAALGPYAWHLDDATWRQGVLKCVFMGLPLSVVDSLRERADPELGSMLAALYAERTAAGRVLADDALELLAGTSPAGTPAPHEREAPA
jgi:hypothetical protein